MQSFLLKIVISLSLLLTLPTTMFASTPKPNYIPSPVYQYLTDEEIYALAEGVPAGDLVTVNLHGTYEDGQSYSIVYTGTVTSSGWVSFPNVIDGPQYKKGKRDRKPKGNQVPVKRNGGTKESDFINTHAYEKHRYNPEKISSKNRTQYGKDVDVKALREMTMNDPEQAWTTIYKNGDRITAYRKQFNGNISTSDSYTDHHRVFIHLDKPEKSTQYPLYLRN